MPSRRRVRAARAISAAQLSGVCCVIDVRDHQRAHVLRIFHGERLRHHPAHREARDAHGAN